MDEAPRAYGGADAERLRRPKGETDEQWHDPEANRAALRALDDARFRHVAQREKGKSRALNLGLSRSSAPLVAFTDDDCTLPEDWLATAVRLMAEQPNVGILFGSLTPIPHDAERCFIRPSSSTARAFIAVRCFGRAGCWAWART